MATEPHDTFWWVTAQMEWDGTGYTHTHTQTHRQHNLKNSQTFVLIFAICLEYFHERYVIATIITFAFYYLKVDSIKIHTPTRSLIVLCMFGNWLRLPLAASKVCGHECSEHTTTMRIFDNTFQCAKVINSEKLDWQFDDGSSRPIEDWVFGTAFSKTN